MQIKITKIIIAIAAAAILASCQEGQDFYQASSVNSNYRSDQQAPPSTKSGFYMGEAPKTGRGATGAPPSTTASTTTSDAQMPAPAPVDAAPPSTTSVPAAAPAAASSEAPPSTATAAPPSTAQ